MRDGSGGGGGPLLPLPPMLDATEAARVRLRPAPKSEGGEGGAGGRAGLDPITGAAMPLRCAPQRAPAISICVGMSSVRGCARALESWAVGEGYE
eukprot:COSAG01_NODE_435_length_17065_cov_46.870977_2_plen_95_part_00